MVKLIVSDLDGTLLLPGRQQLEDSTLRLVGQVLDAGYAVAAASGRQYANIRRMFGKLADRLLYICENGSLVVYRGKTIYKSVLDREQKRRLLRDLLAHPTAEPIYCSPERCYIQPKEEYFSDLIVNRVRNDTEITENLLAVEDECLKISLYERRGIDEKEEKDWLRRYGGDLYVVRSSEKWMEFLRQGTSKGKALQMLLETMQVSASECMVFGDNDNDVSMMEQVQYSFGMRNGTEALKRASRILIDDPCEILRRLV